MSLPQGKSGAERIMILKNSICTYGESNPRPKPQPTAPPRASTSICNVINNFRAVLYINNIKVCDIEISVILIKKDVYLRAFPIFVTCACRRLINKPKHVAHYTIKCLQYDQRFFIHQLKYKWVVLKKNNIKIYIKTAPTCFGTVTHHQGAH
jgi:hypothetical protein